MQTFPDVEIIFSPLRRHVQGPVWSHFSILYSLSNLWRHLVDGRVRATGI